MYTIIFGAKFYMIMNSNSTGLEKSSIKKDFDHPYIFAFELAVLCSIIRL